MSYILGLSGAYYHDGSACLTKDGRILAFAEEERFTRRKHNKNSRSCTQSTAYCLAEAGIRLNEVESIAIGWNPYFPQKREDVDDQSIIQELLDPRFFQGYTPTSLKIIDHHLSHAASAFYCSGFREATIVVIDGSGDGIATSLGYGTPDGIEFLQQFDFTQSLGWFYETVAEHIGLGDWTSGGKLMGLAAYGQPVYSLPFIQITNTGYTIHLSDLNLQLENNLREEYVDLRYYYRMKMALKRAFELQGIVGGSEMQLHSQQRAYPDESMLKQDQRDLAASAQRKLEDCISRLVQYGIGITSNKNVVIAGGVGLNCSINGKLWSSRLLDNLYVQPAAGDAGCAVGAALEASRYAGFLHLPQYQMPTAYLGPSFSDEEISRILKGAGLPFIYHGDAISSVAAEAIAHGAIIGWFQGRMEAGPRALGNRSILADPRRVEKRDYINSVIKHRELWRPFAPSILGQRLPQYCQNVGPADFMIVAYSATEYARNTIPATIHIDGTLRPQAVYEDTNPRYAALLQAFEYLTGIPAVLNTSFNHEAEPMVCTPDDAIRTFGSRPLDALAIGGFFVTKPGPNRSRISA